MSTTDPTEGDGWAWLQGGTESAGTMRSEDDDDDNVWIGLLMTAGKNAFPLDVCQSNDFNGRLIGFCD